MCSHSRVAVLFAVLLAMGAFLSGPALAQEREPANQAAGNTVQATITDIQGDLLTVIDNDTIQGIAVQVGPETKIRMGGKPLRMGDLKPGDDVTLIFETKDGKNVARVISLKREE